MGVTLCCVSGSGRWPLPKLCLFWLTKNCNDQEGANKDYHCFHTSSAIFNAHTHSGPCLGTRIKLRLCGMWSSNVFSQIARKTDDLPTPNGSGKKMELTGAADWQIQKPLFLMVKGTEHSFSDADCKGQDQKWALWQSTPFQDTPRFAAWTAVTTHPSLSYTDTVGLGRHS